MFFSLWLFYGYFICGVHAISTERASMESSVHLPPMLSIEVGNSNISLVHYFENDSVALEKRTDVKDCLNTVWKGATWAVNNIEKITQWIRQLKVLADEINDYSIKKQCGLMIGTSGEMKYAYSTTSKNCDTTAEKDTIQGALDKAFEKYIVNNLNAVWCMELSHGGSWKGYALVGHGESWPSYIWCGSGNKNTCASGGKNDVIKRELDGHDSVYISGNYTAYVYSDGMLLHNEEK
ncbi:hypothetical protein KAFR_0F00115 [Kazachstania africana CBS 2517]|uniref:Secreted protein CSS2 C-terminal domain-containing protein n=1 Tax=Kazachstania africana (strain ATCC 22294 / BCRC 22015 / CBS 2517 / CECT 1963 / NBRC 1671 / NRRL Y-8276) TaxID=1071382 RepID=H2AW55_KAZAF|nr:hypothetical protein KAFR_0F00115 [Kazachstania africana CBS 2517]CCF58605.1 hypothetical protein KAFR_0F00115 [Kazachstania africana CBS 2517]